MTRHLSTATLLLVCILGAAFVRPPIAEASKLSMLQWEWPGGRSPNGKLLGKIVAIEAEKGGLFGIRKSPSVGDYLPEATIVSLEVLDGAVSSKGSRVALRIPRPEMRGAEEGAIAAVGLVEGDIAICFDVAPHGATSDELAAWFKNWRC